MRSNSSSYPGRLSKRRHAYRVLRERHIDIPNEIALLGFDDFELADALEPPVSVVRQPVVEIARRAAEMLFQSMEHTLLGKNVITMRVELVSRRSCGELR